MSSPIRRLDLTPLLPTLAACALLAACERTPAPEGRARPAPSVEVVASAAAKTTPLATAPEPVAPAAAKVPTPPARVAPPIAAIMEALCPKEHRGTADGAPSCAVCPPITRAALPGGDGVPDGPFGIDRVIVGSFTAPSARELWVGVTGCSAWSGDPLPSIIVKHEESGTLRATHFAPTLTASQCVFVPHQDQQRPLCTRVFAKQGVEQTELVHTVVKGDQLVATPLLKLDGDMAACMRPKVEGHELQLGAAHAGRVEVTHRSWLFTVPAPHENLCDAEDAGFKKPAPNVETLAFVYDGNTFLPADDNK